MVTRRLFLSGLGLGAAGLATPAAAGRLPIVDVDLRGSIDASAHGIRPGADDLPYAMAKAGLNALTLALAGAWPPKVRANLVLPGAFETDIAEHWAPGTKEAAASINPMQRIGQPEDMVGVCLFLASDGARMLTAQTLIVDGGFL